MAEHLSFNGAVKEELAHIWAPQECCRRSELAALLRACGTIRLQSGRRLACSLTTDHGSIARKAIRLARECYRLTTEIVVKRRRRLRKNLAYTVRIPHQEGLDQMLRRAGVLDGNGVLREALDLAELDHDGCVRAFLRGFFLGCGWVNAPEREHHLEWTVRQTETADTVGQALFSLGVKVRMAGRKENVVLYVKDAEQVSRVLVLVGAHQAVLRYEDIRVLKEMKNLVNRQVNAETANLTKSVEASGRQIEALQNLAAAGGLERLSPSLRELAQLRLSHPDANLKELGEMCNPPLGKSGVNHRMRALMRLCGVDEVVGPRRQ